MSKNTIVGEREDSPLSDKAELDLKITKIRSMVDTVNKRIEAHENRLNKFYKTTEKDVARNQIARLTQAILESS